MKLALVSRGYSLSWGGAEMVTASLARAFKEAGHEVTVFVERVERGPDSGLSNDNNNGIRVEKVPTIGITSTLKRLSFQRNLRALLARADAETPGVPAFDVVLGLCQYFPLDVYRASGGVHAHWMRLRYESGPLRALKYVTSPVHLVMAWIERRLAQGGNCRSIITNSRLVKTHVIEYLGAPEENVHVVYNGVDHARFNPEVKRHRREVRNSLGIDEGRTVALFVSNNWKRKGLETIIRALPGIDNLSVVVVGRGSERPFRAMAERLGLGREALVFAGVQKDIERFYGASDFFVLPTRYDPCSNACMEAMACALAVITTESNGASEFIADGENGLILRDPADHETLRGFFLRLMQNDISKTIGEKTIGEKTVGEKTVGEKTVGEKTMGEKASYAMKDRTWERTAEETLKLCEAAFDEKRG